MSEMEAEENSSKASTFCATEKYEVRSGTINLGYDYEYKTVTLVSLRCLRQFKDFDDVWIAFNATSVGAMDDVVVIAQKKGDNGKIHKVKIMIQLKHKEKGTDIVESQFLDTKSNGTYSLLKYYKDIIKLKERLASKGETTPKILQHIETVDDNTYFVLFTNKNTKQQIFLECGGCDAISFLNTNSENIYSIDLSKVSTISSLPSPNNNINFSFFAKQSSANHLSKIIDTEIENLFQHFELTDVLNIENISEKFVKFVTRWAMGKLGGHYFLTKKDILCKLTELLLSRFEVDLSGEEFDFYDCFQKLLWNEVVKYKPITIVDEDEEVEKFLKLYIGSEVRPYCQTKKKWCYKLSTKEQSSFYEQHTGLKTGMLKVAGNFGKITALTIYKCLWFSEQLPLLLKVKTIEDYKAILKILKLSNFNLKVIIVNGTKSTLNTEEVAPICFATLSDLNEGNRLKILNCSAKLQGRSSVALDTLIDDSLFKHFNCNAIIDILLGNYNIGTEFEPLSTYFIHRSLLKVFLKREVLEQANDVFLIETDQKPEDSLIRNKLNMLLSTLRNKSNIVIVNETLWPQIAELKTEKAPIHRLIFRDNNLFEWKESFGSTSNIRNYQVRHRNDFKKYVSEVGGSINDTSWICNELEDILENKSLNDSFNNVNLVSASPGMGKSTILDYMASKASTKMWVLNVDLIDHDDHYGKTEALTAQDHLNYFYGSSLKNRGCNNNKLAEMIFQKFVNGKNVLIMLDGFDEVAISRKIQVMEIANSLHEAGFPIWITTRPHPATDLETKFDTISVALKPFSVEDQENFLNRYFVHVNDKINANRKEHQTLIEEFVKKLVRASRNNLSDNGGEFMGIPLQTKLLADAFKNELKDSLEKGVIQFEQTFDLLRLYEKFFHAKDVILRDKLGVGAINTQELFRKQRQLFALKLLFPNSLLCRLSIEAKLKKFYKNNEAHIHNLQQDGLTIIQRGDTDTGPKLQVSFVHRTFAEYMAACWLKKKVNSKRDSSRWTAKIIIRRGLQHYTYHKFLFKMFNSMLAKDFPMQMLIINNRSEEALKLAVSNLEAVCMIDAGGRSYVHMIAFYGSYRWSDYFVNHPELVNMDDNFGYSPLDYAILRHSFDVANKLSVMSIKLSIAVNVYDLGDTLEQRNQLIQLLLPFIVCQQLLDEPNSVNRDANISQYYYQLFKKDDYHAKYKTVSELLTRVRIRSATEPYYYHDLHFAAAYGTTDNVHDLITSRNASTRNYNFNNICTPLCCAVKHNRLEIVKILLCNGKKVDEPCMHEKYHTALHCACKMGYIDIVKELLSCQADTDVQDEAGNTPLILALEYKYTNVAKLLLSNHANATIKNICNNYPAYYAAKNGWDDMILDLSKGIDINYREYEYNNTLLHVALLNGHVTTAQLLLCSGADCNIPNSTGELPLHIAAKENFYKLVPEILSKTVSHGDNEFSVNIRTKKQRTPLHMSLMCDTKRILDSRVCLDTTKLLLNSNADVSIHDLDGNTVLHFLCRTCSLDLEDRKDALNLLLNAGADINAKNNDGKTSAHVFLQHLQDTNGDHLVFLQTLVNRDAQVDISDNDGNTVFHYLCIDNKINREDRKNAAKHLLEKNADINFKNNNGETPLHLFVQNNSKDILEMVRFFLDNGADVNIQDAKGNTVLYYLFSNDGIAIEDIQKAANILLIKHADVNLKNINIQTPLHLLMQNSSKDLAVIATFFLENGADVNIQDVKGDAPLHYLLRNNKVNTENKKNAATVLLRRGADVNLINKNHQTPLYLVLQSSSEDFSDIVGFLLDNGADGIMPDIYGNNVLHYLFSNARIAAENKISVANTLISKGADIHLKNKSGKAPLRVYMETNVNDISEIATFVLNLQADINTQDNVGSTPLHDLCSVHAFFTLNRKSTIEFVLNSCALVNMKDAKGRTPLHVYISQLNSSINKKDLSEIVPLLLNKQADVNMQDNNGNTALHYLCYSKEAERNIRREAVELLLTKNADVNLRNNNGETVFHFLLQHLPSPNNARTHFEIFGLLLSKEAQMDVQDNDGNTALHYLCREWTLNKEHRRNTAKLLLDRVSNINLKNSLGATALHCYIFFLYETRNSRDLSDIVPLLLNKGADVNIQDNDGNTLLHYLCCDRRIKEDIRKSAVKLLLDKDPAFNIKNNEGITVADHP